MSRLHTSFVLGYHGCDRAIGEQALAGSLELIQSDQDHDWLGPGVYFWEGDPLRAREWAEARVARQPGMHPYVIGAVIDLGHCLDLTTRDDIELLRDAYQGLLKSQEADGKALPRNRDAGRDSNRDKLLRNLDCAVIRYLHDSIEEQITRGAGEGELERFDTVRGCSGRGRQFTATVAFTSGPTPKSPSARSVVLRVFSFLDRSPISSCPTWAGARGAGFLE